MLVRVYLYICVWISSVCSHDLFSNLLLQDLSPKKLISTDCLDYLPCTPASSWANLRGVYQQEVGVGEKSELDISVLLDSSLYAFPLHDTLHWPCRSTEGGYITWLSPHSRFQWPLSSFPFRPRVVIFQIVTSPVTALCLVTFLCKLPTICISFLFLNSLQITHFECAICFLLRLIDTVCQQIPLSPMSTNFLPLLKAFLNSKISWFPLVLMPIKFFKRLLYKSKNLSLWKTLILFSQLVYTCLTIL